MLNYIIREVYEPDFEHYFYGDMFSPNAGDYGYTIFGITSHYGNYSSGINSDEFKYLTRVIDNLIDDIESIGDYYTNMKEIMRDYGIPYSPRKAHDLKELTNLEFIDAICLYLTIKTGKTWATRPARGYCQGDYADMIYCAGFYTEHDIDIIADMYMGCGKEFSITFMDEAGDEGDTVYGYYVADCQAWRDEDYKKIVCEYEGINPDEAQLELIESVRTIHEPIYRTA